MNDPSLSTQPVSLSFQEFRDEEIVDFFANDNRTFRPDNVGENFGRSRLVGVPHFSKQHNPGRQKGTAAFRVSFQAPSPVTSDQTTATISDSQKRKFDISTDVSAVPSFSKAVRSLGSAVGGVRQAGSRPGISASVNNDTTGKKRVEKPSKKGIKTSEDPQDNDRPILMKLSFPGPRRLPDEDGVASHVARLLEQLQETDQQLSRLVETWPRLSPRLKETITALIEVGEKTPETAKAQVPTESLSVKSSV